MMSMIGCAEVVSVSTSCSGCYSLTQSSLFPALFIMLLYSQMPCSFFSYLYIQRSQIPVSVRFTTFIHPFYFLKSLPKLQPELKLKVITRLEMSRSEQQSFLEMRLRLWKSTQRRSEPSFFLTNKTSALCRDEVGRMKPVFRFSSINSFRASCSDAKREYIGPTRD